jgi:hypothetical protein
MMKTLPHLILAIVFCSFHFSDGKNHENPVLFYGSTFGEYFQRLHKQGKYTEMLEVTSSETIKKFGRDKLMMFYEQMDFSYTLKLKSMNSCTLFYETVIFGTKRTLKFHYCIANGKCKVVFHKLDPINPFW